MSEQSKVVLPVFDDAGMDTSGQPGPEKVLLLGGLTGKYIGAGLGLYVDPATETLNIAEVLDGEPEEMDRFPTDYEVYFATMVITTVLPILRERWEDEAPLTDEEVATFYALPVYEDHQLPKPPPDGGL